MTTADTKTAKSPGRFRLPDPPQREPDEMTQFDQLSKTGNTYHLARHFGNPETTLVEADRWMIAHPSEDRTRARRPDLMVAFHVAPADYEASNGYIVSEQGKPPDFVLEVASESTASIDVGAKRDDYAALGILEYWRFDKTGEFHGARLAGDRLVDGAYQPIPIDELDDAVLQGYSPALNLILRWERGQLGWYDPATEQHIATLDSEHSARIAAEARAENAEARAVAAEARIRELEQRLQQQGS
jgi:Uma2 family endonuclease